MTTPSRIVSQVVWSYVSWGLIFITGPLSVALLTRSLSIREFGIFSLLVILIRVLPRVLSLGVPTTEADVDLALDVVPPAVARLRSSP